MGIKYDGLNLVWLKQFGSDQITVSWVSPDAGDIGTFVGGSKPIIQNVVRVVNGPAVVYSVVAGALPLGLVLNASTGVITGTLNNSNATYSYTIRATSGSVFADRSFSATVATNQPPVWVTNAGSLGEAFDSLVVNFQFEATDPEAQPVTYRVVAGGLPFGLTLNGNTGMVTGTLNPVTDDTTFFFTIGASDGVQSTNRGFSFTTLKAAPPVWITPPGTLGTQTELFDFAATLYATTSNNNATYSIVFGQLPGGLTLNGNTGIINGTVNAVGIDTVYNFTASAADGIKATHRDFSIKILQDRAPVWQTSGSLGQGFGGASFSATVVATDPNGKAVTYAMADGSSLPGTLVLNSTTGAITGTLPTPSSTTNYNFSIVANDGRLTSIRSFSIKVLFNVAPVWDTANTLTAVVEEMHFVRQLQAHDPAGVQPITYSMVSGEIPVGTTLYSNGALVGTPIAVASNTDFVFDVEANNGVLASTKEFTLTVQNNEAPVWTTNAGTISTVQAKSLYSYQLVATDPNGASPALVYTLQAGSLPGGLTLDSSGNISGVLSAVGSDTEYDFAVSVSDGYNPIVTRAFSIVVTKNDAPVWATNAGVIGGGFETAPLTLQVHGDDPEGAQVSYNLVNGSHLPSGMFLNPTTGVITGTLPSVTQDTPVGFSIYLNDGTYNNANRVPRAFTINVLFNSPPTWVSPANLGSGIEGLHYSNQLQATGVGNGPMIYTLDSGTLPAGITLSSAGLLSGTLPAAATDTPYTFTVKAYNGIKSATRDFTLTVAHNLAPVWATNAGVIASVLGNVNFSVQLSAPDPNSQNVTYALTNATTLPSGVTLSAGGLVSGKMAIVANSVQTDFTVRATDGVLSADRNFSLIALAEAVPTWVTAAGSIGQVFKSTFFSGTVQAVDPQNLPLTYTVVSGALPVGLTLNANSGAISGITPNVSANTFYDFTIRASNGTLSSDRAFQLEVTAVSSPVWSTPAGSLGSVLSGYSASFGMSATDPQSIALTYSFISGTLPPGMSFLGGGQATVYTPGASTVPITTTDSTYSFIIEVTNGFVAVQRSFSITIHKNLAPVWDSPAAGLLGNSVESGPVHLTFTAHDPESIGISYAKSSGSFPPGLGFNPTTGVLAGNAGTVSSTTTYDFTLDAYDGVQTTSRAFSYTINFSSPPIWTTASGSLGSALEQTQYTANVVATSDGQPVQYTLANGTNLPSGLTLNSATGQISGMLPPVVSDSTFNFTLTATSTLTNKSTNRDFSIGIINDLPPVWSTPAGNFLNDLAGTSFSKTLAAVDPNGTTVTYVIANGTLPGSVTFDPNGAGDTAVLSGTLPVVGNNTTYSITVGASDGATQVNRVFSFTSQLDVAPTWTTPAGSLGNAVQERAFYSTTLVAVDPNGKPVTYALDNSTTLPTGLIVNATTGVISGTLPAVSNALGGNDIYNFDVAASDGTLHTGRSFTLTVKPNAAPVWVTNAGLIGNVVEGNAATFHLIANDPDGDTVTYALANGTQVAPGFTFFTNGAIIGRAGTTPTDTNYPFDVAASDGFKSTNRSFSMTLTFDTTNYDANSASVNLLMPFEGTPGSSTLVDQLGHVITDNGALLSSTQAQFGNTSVFFNGSSSFTTPMTADLNVLNLGVYTVEFWFYPTDNITTQYIISQNALGNDTNSSAVYWGVKKTNGVYTFNVGPQNLINGNSQLISIALGNVLVNQWQHIAICKGAAGTRAFLNGVQQGIGAINGTALNPAVNMVVGQGLTGYMDDLRVTNVARYNGNFTPGKAPPVPVWITNASTVLASGLEGNAITNAVALSFTDTSNLGIKQYLAVGSLPTGLTLNQANGVLTGVIPQAVQGGTVTVTAQGMDGNNNLTAPRSFLVQSNALSNPSDLQFSWRFNKQVGAAGLVADVGTTAAPVLHGSATATYVAAPAPHATDTALQFIGASYMVANTTTNLRFLESSNWTVEMWAYAADFKNGGGAGPRMFSAYTTLNTGNGLHWYVNGNTGISGIYLNTYSAPFPQPTNNAWNHFALVRNGDTMTAYTNGIAGTPATGVGYPTAGQFDNHGIAINGIYDQVGFALAGTIYRGVNLWSTSKYSDNFNPAWDDFLSPVWANTALNNLGTNYENTTFNSTVTAFSFGNTAVTYSVNNSGTMPAGLNLVSNGYVYGKFPSVHANVVTSFALVATDPASHVSPPKTFTVTSVSQGPTWVSNSTLGNNQGGTPVAKQLVTTDPLGALPVTYTLQSGTLPAGLSLSNTGLLSGTLSNVSTDTTAIFTVNAVNTNGYYTQNTFNYTTLTQAVDPFFANIAILLHGNGNFTDSAPGSTLTWAAATGGGQPPPGTATSTTAQYGGGSIILNNNATVWQNALRSSTVPNNAKYALGAGDWTIEGWANVTAFPSYVGSGLNAAMIGSYTACFASFGVLGASLVGSPLQLYFVSLDSGATFGQISIQTRDASGNVVLSLTGNLPTPIALNTWNHIAFSRTGNTVYIFVNGILLTSGPYTGSINYPSGSPQWSLGQLIPLWNSYPFPFNGYIDDFRVTVGKGRYTSNFSPPSIEFPNTGTLAPVWANSGSLGFAYKGSAISVGPLVANPVTQNSLPVTYSLISGSLPGTTTLNSNGLITGVLNSNVTTDTVDSFTIRATDNMTHIADQTFTYTTIANADVNYNNVSLLIHGETTANNGVVIDSTGINTFGTNNAANVSTAASKFGNSAIFFNGAGSTTNIMRGLQGPPTFLANWLGTTDWTLEAWINPIDLPNANKAVLIAIGNQAGGTNYWNWSISGSNATTVTNMDWVTLTGGVVPDFHTTVPAGAIQMNTWTHVALTRASGVVRGFVNGALLTNAVVNTSAYNGPSSLSLQLGGVTLTGAPSNFHGYMDEIRITTGVARYTAAFTPPTGPFANLLDPSPVWANSGSLGLSYKTSFVNVQLASNSPVNANPVTYSLISGALPGTSTLFANGRITGVTANVTTDAVDTFTIRATDTLAHTTDRTFTYTTTANADVNYNNVSLMLHAEDTPNGTTIADSTGKQTFTKNTASVSTASSKFGNSAIYFDGSNSALMTSTTNPQGVSFPTGTDFTVEAWFNQTSSIAAGTSIIMSHGPATWGGVTNVLNIWAVALNSNATAITNVQFYNQGGSGGSPSIIAPTPLAFNTWNHVAVTRKSGTTRIFVNGVLSNSIVDTFNYQGSASTAITMGGFYINQFPSNMIGYVDEVRVTNGVARYVSNFSVPTSKYPDILDPSPVWANAGSLGSTYKLSPLNVQVVANPVIANTTPITYTVVGGALPGTTTLNSNGLITGTTANVALDTVDTFTIRATDALTHTVDQTFTYTTIANADAFYNNVSTLVHAEDTPNASVILDSTGTMTFALNGAVQVSNAAAKFGNSSMFFNGTLNAANVMQSQVNPPKMFGSGDFTVEAWVNPINMNAVNASFRGVIASVASPTVNGWSMMIGGSSATAPTSFIFYTGVGGAATDLNANFSTPVNTWTHIAVTRQGSTMRVFANGVLSNSVTSSLNYAPPAGYNLQIGGITATAPFSGNWHGYIDEFRITNGVARYVSNFTPPTGPFPNLLDSTPVWTTSNTVQVSGNATVAVQLTATAPSGTVTYAVANGTLPSGTTLQSNGVLTGVTANVSTVTNSVATITATDSTAPAIFFANNTITFSVNPENAPNLQYSWRFNRAVGSTDFTPSVANGTTITKATAASQYATGNGVVEYITAPAPHSAETTLRFSNYQSSLYYPSTGTDFRFLTSSFTIEMWVYPIAFINGNNQTLLGINSNDIRILRYDAAGNNKLTFFYKGTNITLPGAADAPSANLTMNAWNHVAVTRDGSSLAGNIFLNGVQGTPGTTTSQTSTAFDNVPLIFNNDAIPTGGTIWAFPNMSMHSVQFWNTVKYTGNFTPQWPGY